MSSNMIQGVAENSSSGSNEPNKVGTTFSFRPRTYAGPWKRRFGHRQNYRGIYSTPNLGSLESINLQSSIFASSTTRSEHKMISTPSIDDSSIDSMYSDSWRSKENLRSIFSANERRFPDGSIRLRNKMGWVPHFKLQRLALPTTAENSQSIQDVKESKSGEFIPGRRCGFILVDIRNDAAGVRKVSLLSVRGITTVNEFGETVSIWSFPKGQMIEGETVEECALRELEEETGIKLETTRGLPRIILGKNIYFILHTTKETFNQFEIIDTSEVQNVAWMTAEELRNVDANKDIRAVLRHRYRIIFEKLDSGSNKTEKCSTDWQKWKGQVMGNEEEIKDALKILGREPTSFRELEDKIFEARDKKLGESLSESNSSW